MGYFCERLVDGVLASAGSDSGAFITDLKTVRGIKNRILNGNGWMAGEWVIYKFAKAFDESSYNEVGRFVKKPKVV